MDSKNQPQVKRRSIRGRHHVYPTTDKLMSLYKSFRFNKKRNNETKDDLFDAIKKKYPDLLKLDLKAQNNHLKEYDEFMTELRAMPISIQEKKTIIQKLHNENKNKKSKTSKLKIYKQNNFGSNAYYNAKHGLKSIWMNIVIFGKILASPLKNEIKQIETNYDRGIASYFSFLKWLIFANIVAFFLFLLPFLIAPHVTILSQDIDKTNYSYCLENSDKYSANNSLQFDFIDFLVANNSLKLAFYGCFGNKTYSLIRKDPSAYYNMQYAYLLVIIVYFLYWLFKTASSLSKAISHNFILAKVILNKTLFVDILFINWDYKLTKRIAVKEKMNQMHLELTSNLAIVKNKTTKTSERRIFLLITTNLLYLIICCAIGSGIYYFSDQLQKLEYFDLKNVILAIFICLLNYALPNICKVFASFEKFKHKSTETTLSLFRIFLVQIVTLGFTVGSSIILNKRSTDKCYETKIAQLIYTIIIIDFLFFFFDCLLVIFKKIAIDRFIKLFIPKYNRDFDIAYYTFSCFFSQALIWIGTYYSPFFTGLQIIKLLTIFFIEAKIVKTCYYPSKEIWPASKNTTYFLLISLIGFLLVMTSIGYLNITYPSSNDCGPFTDLTFPYDYLYQLKEEIENSSQAISTIIVILLSPGLISFILFILCVGVYGFYIAMSGYKESVSLLKTLHDEQKQKRNKLNTKKKTFLSELNENEDDENANEDNENEDDENEIESTNAENRANYEKRTSSYEENASEPNDSEYEDEHNDQIVKNLEDSARENSRSKLKKFTPMITSEEDEINKDLSGPYNSKKHRKIRKISESSTDVDYESKNDKIRTKHRTEDIDKIERVKMKKPKKNNKEIKF